MPTAYCPNCRRIVQAEREDLDAGLAIFLFCCTGSIGFWIYLLIYFLKPEDRCVFCNHKIEPYLNQPLVDQQPNMPQNVQYQPSINYVPPPIRTQVVNEPPKQKVKKNKQDDSEYQIDENTGEIISSNNQFKFCPICGTQFKVGQKFCSACGTDLSSYQ